MSTIIGICSSKFCLLVADRRSVSIHDGSISLINDKTDKIFKLNDDVVYGVTGVFAEGEELLDPLNCLNNNKNITLNKVLNAIKNYTIDKFPIIKSCKHRNYIFGGKQNGKYHLCIIQYNAQTEKFEYNEFTPTGDGIDYHIILPNNAIPFENELKSDMSEIFTKAKTVDELILETVKVIAKIADIDNTVGKTMNYYIVK